jgi:quinol monooxygenase YgiN
MMQEDGMLDSAVHLMVELSIDEGKLETFQGIAAEMIAQSREEAGTLSYEWYLRSDRKLCRVLETYASGEDMLAHLNGPVTRQLIPKLIDHAMLDRIEVYGDVGAKVKDELGRFGAQFFERWGGLADTRPAAQIA